MDIKESGGCTVAFWGSIKNAFVSIIPHGSKRQSGRQKSSGFDAEGDEIISMRPQGDELEAYCAPATVIMEKTQGHMSAPVTMIEPPVGMDDYYPGAGERFTPEDGEVHMIEHGDGDDNNVISNQQQQRQSIQLEIQPQQGQQELHQKNPVDPGIIAPPPSAKGLGERDDEGEEAGKQQRPVITAHSTAPQMADMKGFSEDKEKGDEAVEERTSTASPPCPSSPPPQPQGCTSCSRVMELQKQVGIPISNPSPLSKSQLDLSLPCVELE